MPYIKQHERSAIDEVIDAAYSPIVDVGQLNYAITRLVNNYLGPKPKYADFNEAIGVLECAKLELYRRAVVPYEEAKRALNGDCNYA